MSTRLITFNRSDSVVEAMAVLLKKKISGAPVVDDEGNLIGILSEKDLMAVVMQDSYYDEGVGIVGDYMREEVDVVDPDMDIYSLADRFHNEGRRRFPVVKNGRLVGQISRRDVLRAAEEFLMHADGMSERKRKKLLT
jgi:predicted transcriptional regulator